MPLLAKKLFHYVKPLTTVKDDDKIFTIAHTKEQFRSKSEYEKRLRLYKERIWTCRCTGHVNLTHEEAWNSERSVKKQLKAQFPRCYDKPVLVLVHHSTRSLDTLVDQSWLMLQQVLCIGEKVVLKVKAGSKLIKAVVLKVDTSGVEANPTSNCSSPSSDKENTEKDENSPKKWIPPKLLPYKYTVRLEDEEKIINSVPASEIGRGEKPPSKELLRLFIRSHALRAGQNPNSPWIVDDELVKKHGLTSKFASFLLSPTKWRPEEIAKKFEEESKKRKSPVKEKSSPSKKPKLDKTKEKKKKDKKEKKSSTKTKSEENSKSSKEVVNISASDDESLDSDEESVSDSGDSDVPLSEMKPTPKKKSSGHKPSTISIVTKSGSLDSDVPLSKLKQLTPKKDSSGSKPSTLSSAKKLKTSKSSENIKKKDGKDKNKEKDKKKSLKKNSPKKGLKQMTLLELSKKKGMKTPEKDGKSDEKLKKTPDKNKKTPEKSNVFTDKKKAPSTPAVIQMLMKQLKTENKALINFYSMKAAQTLTPAQRAKLPADIQTRIQKKVEWLEEKRKLAAMSALEKEEYFKKKKEIRKEKFREYSRKRAKELNKKCEDTELDLKPLPQPKLVVTPEGLPNETFGDVAMVAEFIACYAGLLMPDEEYPIYTDALMKALTGGKEGFAYLSRVLVILLQTLLQDKISEDYQEINVSLSDIPVNPFTASELVRLCLRKRDASHNHEEEEEEEDEDEEVPDELIQLLVTKEMYQLEPVQKLQILKGMCLRIMATYSVQDYMEEKQQEASKLWKEKLAQAKEDKKKNRNGKNQNAENENKMENKTDASAAGDGLSVPHFYGSKLDDKSQPSSDADSSIDVDEGDNNDLASVVKKRRQLAAKVAAEKAKKEEERRIQKEKEYEKYRKEKERENFEKKFSEGIALAKSVLRQTPIGTDRNHNRYWIFNSSTTPGLYVEKGWVGDEIEYSNYNESENEKEEKAKSASSSDEESEASESGADPKSQEKEKTFPYPGQNLWFTYESVKDLDALVESLHPQGIREKALKNELKKRYQEVSKAIMLFQRNNKELRDSDGDKEMLEVFKKELQDTELKLRNGGLGGVPNFQIWDTKLTTATDIKELAGILLEVQEHVVEKFKQGIMAPKSKKKKPTPTEVKEEQVEDEEEDKEEEEETELKVVKGIAAWREAVEKCSTLSRLHTLLGILDSSIKWEKSAENAKCKICRKKSEDAYLLLCDECNQAFHMFCLRPALVDVPPGDWFCPACAPLSRRRQTVKYGGYMEDSNSEGEDEDTDEHDENCHECGGDEGLIFCSECPSAYHLECHDPPLRHPPRGHWLCNDCKNGVTRKTRSGRQVRKTQRRGQSAPSKKRKREYYSSDEEESDEETDEDFGEEDEEENPKPPLRKKAKKASNSRDDKKTDSSNAKSRSQKSKRPGSVDVYETQPPVQISKRAPSELSICEDILNRMLKHKMAWPFLMAVSKKDVPDYYEIVKQPIDLQKIKDKLNVLVYGSPQEVVDDIALMFRNCAQYNQADSEIFDCMEVLEKFFLDLLQKHLPMYYYNRDGTANGYADHMYNQGGNRRSRKSK
ncbi:hypothetical protein ACJMK2_019534 [Sinanodonta woodiana]|uniref:Tyrosine-protein kinase BAZ1B n=1 Tax=Sinanodonta woodiana TaxID=1069815 RepID=A0ABD3TX44_SINWO